MESKHPVGHVRFADLLASRISAVVKKRQGESLTPELMRSMREDIRATIGGIFAKSSRSLDERTVVWLTNQYFKGLQINQNISMNDLVVMNEYNLSQLPYTDIQLLRNLFDQTSLADELNEEYKRRSAS
jgi:hypothetical protein